MAEKLFFTKRQIWVRPTETGSAPVCSSTPRQRMSQSYRLRSSRHDLQQTGFSGRCDLINIFGGPLEKRKKSKLDIFLGETLLNQFLQEYFPSQN